MTQTVIEKGSLVELEHIIGQKGQAALVVDQSPMVRRCVCDALSILGVSAVGVATNLDAFAQLQANDLSAVTVFVGMPFGSSNGAELARFLREEHPELRVVSLVHNSQVFERYEPFFSVPDSYLRR